jgi:excisionase family DNA binding protein
MTDSPFLTVDEVAALLRVPVRWVYEQTCRVRPDSIPRYKAGKRWLFDRGEVLMWFKQTYQPNASDQRMPRHRAAVWRRRPPKAASGGRHRAQNASSGV